MSDGVFWPELAEWLAAHGIEPNETAQVAWRPPHAYHRGGPQFLEVTVFLERDGGRYLDEDGEVATETRVVPMRHLPAVEVVRYRWDTVGPDADDCSGLVNAAYDRHSGRRGTG